MSAEFYSGVFVGAIMAAIVLALFMYIECQQYRAILSDSISRSYAIEQIELAILESQNDEDREYFERFKDFLNVLPEVEF